MLHPKHHNPARPGTASHWVPCSVKAGCSQDESHLQLGFRTAKVTNKQDDNWCRKARKHSIEKQSNAWKTLKCGMKTEPRKCLPSLLLTLIFFSWNIKNFPHIVRAEKKHYTIFYNGYNILQWKFLSGAFRRCYDAIFPLKVHVLIIWGHKQQRKWDFSKPMKSWIILEHHY